MKNTLKRVFAAVMAAAMLPVIQFSASAADEPSLVVNESYDSYITYDMPDLPVQSRNWYITEHGNKDKGLLMYASLQGSTYTVYAAGTKNTVISFDLKATDIMPTGQLIASDASGRELNLMTFSAGRGAGASNGLPLSGFGKARATNYTVVYRAGEKTCDIYVNGRAKVTGMKLKSATISDISDITFAFSSNRDAQGVIIDNVNIYSSDHYVPMAYPRAEYNEEAYEPVELAFGPQIGQSTLAVDDFDSGSSSMYIHTNQNNLKVITDRDNPENKVYLFERLSTGDSHYNVSGLSSASDSVVYEFDVRVNEEMSVFNITFKDSNAKFSGAFTLKPGYTLLASRGGESMSLKPGKWYKLSAIQDFYNRKTYAYVDGVLFSTGDMPEDFMVNGANMDTFRIHMTHGVGGVTENDPINFEVDNVRVYEGDKLIEGDLGQIERTIDVRTKMSVFPKDTPQKNLMTGYQGFHGTSGVCYVDGKKVLLRTATYIKDGVAMMPAEALAEAFGFDCAVDGTKVTFNGVVINGEIKDGIAYIPAPAAAKAFGKIVTNVPATYNAHMYIIGSQSFKMPEDQSEIDLLNDYLLYYRPDLEEFKKLYNESELAGVHPRIQFTQADFDRMAALTETDPWMSTWKDRLLNTCENYIKADLLIHEKYDGVRMNFQRHLSKRIHALAVAYNLTKDQRYLDRAYAELENVALFPDWNPTHHLDTCEAMAAFAVGYDWLYNYFTPEQREVLEKGMFNNGLYDSWLGFQSGGSKMSFAFTASNNHGNVDNTGALMAALAFMDVYPDECAYVGSNSLRGAELCMYKWAPEGVWYEGAGYWELTMQFTAKWLDTLTTIWPETAGLGMHNLQGMDKAALAEVQSQTPLGIYNFADAMPQNVYVPEMLYLANAYNIDGVYKACIDAINGKWVDDEDLGLAMMLYLPEMYESSVPLENDYFLERIDTIMMRNTWDSKSPTVVGIHGGMIESGHDQLDTGSFIYENGGVRWSVDMGMGEYNSLGYWDYAIGGKRWNHYRSRAESHSTIFTSPAEHEDHKVANHGEMTVHSTKPRGGIVTIDMSDTLYDVSKATRGFAFTDNRQSLVIRDEISLLKTTDVIWSMITQASAEIIEGENKAILLQNGKELEVTWTSSTPVTAEFATAQALPTSPEQTDDFVPGKYKFLRLKANTGGDFTLTVKLTPVEMQGIPTPVAEWDKPISEWSIPDGEIPAAPQIDYVYAGGQKLSAGTKTELEFSVVEGVSDSVPVIEASSDIYNVTIEQAASLDDFAKVIVADKNDQYNRTVYTVKFTVIKAPLNFPGTTSIPVMGYEVSEVTQEANPPIHMFDNDQSTRYAVSGVGQWAILDLGSSQSFDNVMISFMSGHVRQQKIVILVSDDGASWTELWKGMSCGTTEDLETFKVPGAKGRYIKLELNGNTQGGENWNSLTSVFVTKNN